MNVLKTKIPDVLIIEPKVFGDDNGSTTPVILIAAKDLNPSNGEMWLR